jgi:hypothetical protein
MTYAYFFNEDMPFPCKVKIQNIIKTLEKAEKNNKLWEIAIPHGLIYLWIEKFDKDEYVVRKADVNPLTCNAYPYDIITRFFTFNEVIDYIKEQVIDP